MNEGMKLLLAEKAKGRSTAAIARDLGYARTSIALVFSGNYPVEPTRVLAKAVEVYGGNVACPHLGREIDRTACDEHRLRPMPTSSAAALKHWTACKTCPRAAVAAPKKRT